MIRINLLPIRAAKKKESVRFQLTVAGLIILSVVAIMAAVYLKFRSDISLLGADIAAAEKELEGLKVEVGELTKLKEQKRVVQSKLDVVKKLESARTGPVDLFTKVSTAIPARVWLQSLQDRGRVVSVNGYASSDEAVADFMKGLEGFSEFGKVELVVVQRAKSKPGAKEAKEAKELVEFSILIEKK